MKDKRQQMAILQRKRGELVKALKESLAEFTRLGIKAGVYVPEGKDNVAYLLVNETDIGKFFTRRVRRYLRDVDKNIDVKSTFEEDTLVTKVIGKAEIDEQSISESVNRAKEDLTKIGIRAEIYVEHKEATETYLVIDMDSVVTYFEKICKEVIRKKKIKVEVVCYRENQVVVVRIRK